MKKIAIINAKGGTGKTMTAAALAQVFSSEAYGLKVMIIDADPQNDLSTQFGFSDRANLFKLMTGSVWTEDIARSVPDVVVDTGVENISLVPSGYNLFGLELESVNAEKKANVFSLSALAKVVEDKNMADVMIFDCPPHFTPSSVAALIAADVILIPTTSDAHSINGMGFLFQQIEALKRSRDPLESGGVFLTMWEKGQLTQEVENVLRQRGYPVLRTHIRRSPKAQESTYAVGHAVTDYSKRSAAGHDYVALAEELAIKWGWM